MTGKAPIVVAFGGGCDSTAMLAEMKERGIVPDRILFADTGNRDAEKPETYAHVDRMDTLCREWWGTSIEWVHTRSADASLEAACLKLNTLPSIVYGYKSCSQRWKQRAQSDALKGWHEGERIRRAVGINANESHRAKEFSDERFVTWYPLIEWRISRQRVREICHELLGYVPLKSACFFCPSSKPHEVVWLKRNHPALFRRAVEMEQNARQLLVQIKGLGRAWSWEDVGRAGEGQLEFCEVIDTPCMCFDGGDEELEQSA